MRMAIRRIRQGNQQLPWNFVPRGEQIPFMQRHATRPAEEIVVEDLVVN